MRFASGTRQLLFGIADHVDGELGRIGRRCDGHHGDRALLVGEHPDHRDAQRAALAERGWRQRPRPSGDRLVRHHDRVPVEAVARQALAHVLARDRSPARPRGTARHCRAATTRCRASRGWGDRRCRHCSPPRPARRNRRPAARAAGSPAGRSRSSRALSRRTARRAGAAARAHRGPCPSDDGCAHASRRPTCSNMARSATRSAGSASSGWPGSAGTDSAAPRAVDSSSRQLAAPAVRSTRSMICRRTPPPRSCASIRMVGRLERRNSSMVMAKR